MDASLEGILEDNKTKLSTPPPPPGFPQQESVGEVGAQRQWLSYRPLKMGEQAVGNAVFQVGKEL